MNKASRLIKRYIVLLLVLLFSIKSFAAVVGDNDGAAFITKAEFDSLKNDFQSQLDTYNSSIDNKIDGAIASYLAGVSVGSTTKYQLLVRNKLADNLIMRKDMPLEIHWYKGLSILYEISLMDNSRFSDWGGGGPAQYSIAYDPSITGVNNRVYMASAYGATDLSSGLPDKIVWNGLTNNANFKLTLDAVGYKGGTVGFAQAQDPTQRGFSRTMPINTTLKDGVYGKISDTTVMQATWTPYFTNVNNERANDQSVYKNFTLNFEPGALSYTNLCLYNSSNDVHAYYNSELGQYLCYPFADLGLYTNTWRNKATKSSYHRFVIYHSASSYYNQSGATYTNEKYYTSGPAADLADNVRAMEWGLINKGYAEATDVLAPTYGDYVQGDDEFTISDIYLHSGFPVAYVREGDKVDIDLKIKSAKKYTRSVSDGVLSETSQDLSGDIYIVLYYNKFVDGTGSAESYDLSNASKVICMSKAKLEALAAGSIDIPYLYEKNKMISFDAKTTGVVYAKLYPGDSSELAADWEIEVDTINSAYQISRA